MAKVAGIYRARSPFFILPLLTIGACVNLTKVDPGPRFIDNFEDGRTPTWNRFVPWTCDEFMGTGGPDAGTDDAGVGDAGRPGADAATASTCQLAIESPGSDDKHALESVFTLDAPPNGIRQSPSSEIVTHTIDGTVDVTGFSQLVFSAILESAPLPSSPLPASTKLEAGLGCSTFQSDPLATQAVDYTLNAGWTEFRLSLSGFTLDNTSHNQSCLALVDSIHFAVIPGLADGASTGGTLHIDNISLQN
jgi:hypothetical protein